jgi:ferredoxin
MPRYEAWAFIGFFFAGIFSGSGFYTLQTLHYGLWWIHMLGALAFIGFAATGKPGHMVVDLLNVYYGNLDNENPAAKYRLRPSAEPEERACSGEGHAVRFTWKSLMDLDACVRCGRCQDICPAWLTEKPLSPKKLITALKAEMEELPAPLPGAHVSSMPGKGIVSGKSVSGEELWACTSCGACMEVCPVMVEHLPVITELRRREILASGNTPAELAAVFGNLERSFNPQGLNPEDRGAWLLSLEGSPMRTLDEDSDADYLYFPGSWVCFDDRARRATEAFLGIMEAAGIKLGILGAEESDSGDAALRGGNEALWRSPMGCEQPSSGCWRRETSRLS